MNCWCTRLPSLLSFVLLFQTTILSQTLPSRTLLNFNGAKKNNGIEIGGTLSASHSFNKLIVEKGASTGLYGVIAELEIDGSNSATYTFTYFDDNPFSAINFYRIRLINTTTQVTELSTILKIKMDDEQQKNLQLINTVVKQSDPVIAIESVKNTPVTLELYDLSGRLMYSKQTKVIAGVNAIKLSGLNVKRNYYVLLARENATAIGQKIVIQ